MMLLLQLRVRLRAHQWLGQEVLRVRLVRVVVRRP
jgi:hypothetical protein